jgi:DNA-binding transcriptional MocR family regulator
MSMSSFPHEQGESGPGGAVAPRAFRSTTRGDRAYRELRSRILSGKFEPGARLQAEALALTLSMSPTPVREAIQRLVAEGLVEFAPHKGAQVVRQSLADMLATYQLRMTLEPVALSLSIRRAIPDWSLDVRRGGVWGYAGAETNGARRRRAQPGREGGYAREGRQGGGG